MNALLYTLGVVVFAVGVLVSIALHEVGHMYPAKRFGVKVTQYFVGFGRTVWSTRRGETEYGIKAFPLGGFVKLVGMLPPEPGGDPTRVRKSNTGLFTQLVADARTAEYENVRPDEQDRLFYRKPWWQKLVVMTGGPLVNLVIALFLFAVVFMGIGAPMASTTIATVSDCAISDAEAVAGRTCTADDPVTPAKRAGLQPGDTISSFNGQQVTGWPQLTQMIRANGDREATIGLQRDGVAVTETVNTSVLARVSLSDPDRTERVGFLGVTPTVGYVRQGPGFVLSTMGSYTKATGVAIIDLPQRMVAVTKAAFGGVREQDGPMSVVGASRVAGEMVTADETTWTDRVYRILSLIAAVNLFVALFNFIPLLPLDGGHIVGALWEGLRRGWARVAGRPDPGYVDVGKMLPVAYAVGALLLVMGVLLIYADIVNPVRFS
ncbi:MAG: site-2 protease family protein [Nocardioidaceae bacterium]|nr:site-2 protease family protein [Nocardioidaceae bacterium]